MAPSMPQMRQRVAKSINPASLPGHSRPPPGRCSRKQDYGLGCASSISAAVPATSLSWCGSEGQVIGIDETPGTVALAKERAAFRGLSNVDFVASKVDALPFEREFDAVVGRVVLMYRKNPVSDVRNLLRYLKPGCLCVFQEMDLTSGKTMPPAPVIDQVRSWILRAFAQAQIELEMGTKLFSVFKDSGLEEPQMRIDGLIGGCRSAGPAVIANIARILLPQITGLGIASAETVQIDTLESRIRADLERSGSVMSLPLLIGAWARPPA